MQMLGELHADGATVCLATHNPDYIARAQRHIYLFDGRIVDTPVDVGSPDGPSDAEQRSPPLLPC